jgi:hypothetical protein
MLLVSLESIPLSPGYDRTGKQPYYKDDYYNQFKNSRQNK